LLLTTDEYYQLIKNIINLEFAAIDKIAINKKYDFGKVKNITALY
jgi:hypothetical protein